VDNVLGDNYINRKTLINWY